jgi:hypothetical protein
MYRRYETTVSMKQEIPFVLSRKIHASNDKILCMSHMSVKLNGCDMELKVHFRRGSKYFHCCNVQKRS